MRQGNISAAEVTPISRHGLWLLVGSDEYFLAFADFPWFQDATVTASLEVQQLHPGHLYCPRLDVDLELDAIHHPELFPLIARAAE